MGHKFDEELNYDTNDERPKVILRTLDSSQNFDDNRPMVSLRVENSSSSYDERLNAINRGQSKVFLKVVDNPTQANAKLVGPPHLR